MDGINIRHSPDVQPRTGESAEHHKETLHQAEVGDRIEIRTEKGDPLVGTVKKIEEGKALWIQYDHAHERYPGYEVWVDYGATPAGAFRYSVWKEANRQTVTTDPLGGNISNLVRIGGGISSTIAKVTLEKSRQP